MTAHTTAGRRGRLSKAWEHVRTEPGLGRNVAVLAGLLTLAAIVGGVILSNQRIVWPWDDKKIINATFDGAPGVAPNHGQEVRIAGVPVGDIRGVSIDEEGNAKVEMAIEPQHKVYDNATVLLRPKSPLNEMYIVLDPGSAEGREIHEGDTLPLTASRRAVQIDEVLGHLDDDVRHALASLVVESDIALSSAPAALPAGLRNTTKVLNDLKPVAQTLSERRKSVADLVTALGQISAAVGKDDARVARMASSLQATLHTMGRRSDSLNSVLAQLPDLSTQLRESTGAVQALSGQLDPTLDNVREASGELPAALRSLSGTADRLGTTMDVLGPVVRNARPVVRDLRPFAADATRSLGSLKRATVYLDPVTKVLAGRLHDLGGFVLNTRAVTQLEDETTGIIRAQLALGTAGLPAGNPLLSQKEGR